MIIEPTKMSTRPVQPVHETQPAQLDAGKLPDVTFAEMLRRSAEQGRQAAERSAARHEQAAQEQAQKRDDMDINTYYNSAVQLSYSQLDRILSWQNQQEKKQPTNNPAPEPEPTR